LHNLSYYRFYLSTYLSTYQPINLSTYQPVVLQVLAHTERLTRYALSARHLGDLSVTYSPTRGEVAVQVVRLIDIIWSQRESFVSPHQLRAVISVHHEEFGSARPHDAHEFLLTMLEWLNDDLNVAMVATTRAMAKQVYGLPDAAAAERVWRQFLRTDSSIVTDLFYGLQKSTLTCRACGAESSTFETFSVLSLPLADKFSGVSNASSSGSSGSQHEGPGAVGSGNGGSLVAGAAAVGSLYQCLQQYIRGDLITDWTCPHCHQCSHDCFKKLDIWRLPPVIVLHLKRLSFTAAGAVHKEHAHVAFPLRDLDLSQLAIGPAPPQAASSAVYDLYAVVEHHGSSQSGHYTACCYNRQAARWYHMDDVRVKEVPEVEVREAQAYMLCYAAKNSA